ncbi:MAG: alpha/beta hydrolase-fold protein [Pseudomonadota bacterium]
MNPEYIGLQSILTTHLGLSGALVSVTFELLAPFAKEVCLMGEMTDWESAPIPMQRGADGIWRTNMKLRQGQWLYKFIIDGVFIADPCNPLKSEDGLGGYHSYLLIGDGDWARHEATPYGDIIRVELDSVILGRKTHVHLYLPPDYDRSRNYPVLYLLHGYRTEVNQWISNGLIQHFMGNLLSRALIAPFIIAMPATSSGEHIENYGKFLSDELYDWLHRYFAITPGRQAAAVAGMSQFSLSAFSLAQRKPERFGFAAPVSAFYSAQYLQQLEQQSLAIDFGLKLYCGTEDYALQRNERFVAILRKNGIRFDYMRVAGDHTWHYWNSITRDLLIAVSDFFSNGAEGTGHEQ